MRVAIIGAGISGLTSAHLLKDDHQVTIYEKERTPGGLMRCLRIEGSLYHICGGHVFNSKNKKVLDWFWSKFNREEEFTKAFRNSSIDLLGGGNSFLPYPIENHIYQFSEEIQNSIIADWLNLSKEDHYVPMNFSDFLLHRFGKTLYDMYFEPYNEKIWKRALSNVPLNWLEGKLPMPTVEEMLFNNMNHIEERQFVHSSFYYEKIGGSQYIADKLAKSIDIRYGAEIKEITYDDRGKWRIGSDYYDSVIFCGNIKQLPLIIKGPDISNYENIIESLGFHGTTSVFCEIEKNPYSWIYLPKRDHKAHRIICTGNFASTNNAKDKMTATVEFTDEISREDIFDNLKRIPLHPKYLTHHYSKYTYPIQDKDTRNMIKNLKDVLSPKHFYITGRFADWEYYNMDAAIDAAMTMVNSISV